MDAVEYAAGAVNVNDEFTPGQYSAVLEGEMVCANILNGKNSHNTK